MSAIRDLADVLGFRHAIRAVLIDEVVAPQNGGVGRLLGRVLLRHALPHIVERQLLGLGMEQVVGIDAAHGALVAIRADHRRAELLQRLGDVFAGVLLGSLRVGQTDQQLFVLELGRHRHVGSGRAGHAGANDHGGRRQRLVGNQLLVDGRPVVAPHGRQRLNVLGHRLASHGACELLGHGIAVGLGQQARLAHAQTALLGNRCGGIGLCGLRARFIRRLRVFQNRLHLAVGLAHRLA